MTIKEFLDNLTALDLPDDFQIRMGSDAARFDFLVAIGADNDTGVLILYTDVNR